MTSKPSVATLVPVALPHVATGRVHLVDADGPWDGKRMSVTLCGTRAWARVDETGDAICATCERAAGRLLGERCSRFADNPDGLRVLDCGRIWNAAEHTPHAWQYDYRDWSEYWCEGSAEARRGE